MIFGIFNVYCSSLRFFDSFRVFRFKGFWFGAIGVKLMLFAVVLGIYGWGVFFINFLVFVFGIIFSRFGLSCVGY